MGHEFNIQVKDWETDDGETSYIVSWEVGDNSEEKYPDTLREDMRRAREALAIHLCNGGQLDINSVPKLINTAGQALLLSEIRGIFRSLDITKKESSRIINLAITDGLIVEIDVLESQGPLYDTEDRNINFES